MVLPTKEESTDSNEVTTGVELETRPMLRSAGISGVATKHSILEDGLQQDSIATKSTKPQFDFSGLEDMGGMLLEDFDSEDESEEEHEDKKEDDEVVSIVKKFNSENLFHKTELSTDDIERTASVPFASKKLARSFTTKIDETKEAPKKLVTELDILREQLKQANQEIEKYQNFVLQIQKAVSWSNVDMGQAKVHLSFLFASPLLRKVKDGYEQVMLLDYLSEIKDIESNLKNVKYEIKYNKSVATQRNFHSVISDRPIVLHFSGHGVVNNQQSLGSDYAFCKDKGNMLLLEDEHGMSDYLFEKDLKNMIDMMDAKFEVVFIASCHSEFAGRVFSNAGARHVICIQGTEKISDEATLKFAQVFYEMLFVKQYSPCKSFEIAQNEVKRTNFEGESHKFLLFVKEEGKGKKHECNPLLNFTPGNFESLVKDPELDIVPSNIKDFRGRQREMYDVMRLLHDNKLVCLTGVEGMGKSAVLRKLCHHVKHRYKYKDGMLFIDCKDMRSVNDLTQEIVHMLGVTPTQDIDSRNQLILKTVRNKNILLILDNVDSLVDSDYTGFSTLIEKLHQTSDELRIITSSRIAVNGLES